jgi:hypothetical protein
VGVAAAGAGEVLAMGLTWRDLVSSVTCVLMILVFGAFELRAGAPLLSSPRATSAVELVLCCVCLVCAAGDLQARPLPWPGVIFREVTTVLGVTALAAGLVGLAGDSAHAVEILVVATGAVCLTGTIWHALTIGSEL